VGTVVKIEEKMGTLLRKHGWTLSVAESCTGGLVSDRITDVPGSSDYFEGGMVTYSNRAKAAHLFMALPFVEKHGAVSREVAGRMAEGVRRAMKTTFGLSTTGVAGPSGGTEKTPVGTVFIGFSGGQPTRVTEEHLRGSRSEIKAAAAERALKFLLCELLKKSGEARERYDTYVDRLARARGSAILMVRKARSGIRGPGGRLLVFPASFNPPTLAHLALIREAMKKKSYDEVLVLLDGRAMDKRLTGAGLEERLAMLDMLFRRSPEVSIGLSNQGLFVDKLKPLNRHYSSLSAITFLVGFDTLVRVMDPKYYRNPKRSLARLFRESRFLAANRAEGGRAALCAFLEVAERRPFREKVSFIDLPRRYAFISSSLIRDRLRTGRTVKGFLPVFLQRYIHAGKLYAK
jgi:nicotinamide-nucleotide amidase